MKYIPNIITIFRIILSFIILTVAPLSTSFLILYILCGFSDMLDGYIARKTKSTSKLGANLDGLADLIFIVVILFSIIPILEFSTWSLAVMVFIAFIRILSQAIGWIRFHQIAFLHSYLNKVTGLSLFIAPLLLVVFELNSILPPILIIALLSAIEDLILNLTEEKLDLNKKGLFFK